MYNDSSHFLGFLQSSADSELARVFSSVIVLILPMGSAPRMAVKIDGLFGAARPKSAPGLLLIFRIYAVYRSAVVFTQTAQQKASNSLILHFSISRCTLLSILQIYESGAKNVSSPFCKT